MGNGFSVTGRAARLAVLCGLGISSAGVSAQSGIEPYVEYSKLVRASEQASPLNDDLMGDSVSLFNGQTTFQNIDIDLKGNNALPVQLGRKLAITPEPQGAFTQRYAGLGNWDIDVPYITGTFDSLYRWNMDGANVVRPRCSSNFFPSVRSSVPTHDIWHGNQVHIPGRGDNEIVFIETNGIFPADGQPHRWTTTLMDSFGCTPTMANGYPNEGFVMTTTNGVKYTFNIGIERSAGIIKKGPVTIGRVDIYLLASRIEDRFGNYVTYTYNAAGHPTAIASSDGRSISLVYSGDKLSTATTNGRTWTYQYDGTNQLTAVIRPDGSRWSYSYTGTRLVVYEHWDADMGPTCVGAPVADASFAMTVTHPSSAVGVFNFTHMRHYRSGVRKSYCQPVGSPPSGGSITYELFLPNFHDVFSLTSKSISGPGIPQAMNWGYTYGQQFYPLWGTSVPVVGICTTCPLTKTMRLTKPGGEIEATEFGVLWGLNEGKILGVKTFAADGTTVLREERTEYIAEADVPTQAFPARYGSMQGADDPSAPYVRPVIRKTVTQDGASFVWQVSAGCGTGNYCFDNRARPTRVSRASSLGFAKSEDTSYFDQNTLWVLGQTAAVTQTAPTTVPIYQANYSASTALPSSESVFGKLKHSLGWNADGTIASVTDGNGAVVQLSSWKRGVPQLIQHPATPDQPGGASESAVVDNNGWVTSATDENGYTASYQYDAMGRMTVSTPPGGDAVAWNPTTQAFEQVAAAELGIGANHWRQTVSTGNARKLTYFDAMWRPLITQEYDTADQAGTQRFQRYAYDVAGRTSFTSYPSASASIAQGTWVEYDALGRPTTSSQDSELGLLVTRTAYLTGFKRQVTDPRGFVSTQWFQAFDQPSYDTPVRVDVPEGVSTSIARDSFGKPLEISRGGPGG